MPLSWGSSVVDSRGGAVVRGSPGLGDVPSRPQGLTLAVSGWKKAGAFFQPAPLLCSARCLQWYHRLERAVYFRCPCLDRPDVELLGRWMSIHSLQRHLTMMCFKNALNILNCFVSGIQPKYNGPYTTLKPQFGMLC